MTLEIILEVIDQIYGLVEQFLVGTTVHQNGLCTEHLGNLGQDGGTALRDQQVGETSYQRVGGNTDSPSLPPHFIPMTSLLTLMGSLSNLEA